MLKASPIILILLISLGLCGVALSDQLLKLHDSDGLSIGTLLAKVCGGDGLTHSCEANSHSPLSTFHIPATKITVPIAEAGWAYFAFFTIWYIVAGSPRVAGGVRRWIPLLIGLAGAYVSLFLISLMAFGRVPWCGACVAVHSLNGLLLILIAFDAFRRTRPDSPPPKRSVCRPIGALAITIALVYLLNRGRSYALWAAKESSDLYTANTLVDSVQSRAQTLLAIYRAEPLVSIPPSPGDFSPPAPHRLVIFSDLECPACAATAIELRDHIRPLFGSHLVVEFHHFPLCTDCNPAARNLHPNACAAARAAEAAKIVGGRDAFDTMVASLQANREHLEPALYDRLASEMRLSLPAFHQAMNSAATEKSLQWDIKLGGSLGVWQTPTFFLDGRLVPNICMTPLFWQTIAAAPSS
ncbi:MAG: thioredoxin domain-containing protein [Phycisphaerae bacterium]|nr:thioredoxin domain-containing protein [Phycisphaerae bacterium]